MIFDLKNEYMEEIWKDVKGYEELYQVSNYVRYVQLIELLDIGIKENKGYTKVVC